MPHHQYTPDSYRLLSVFCGIPLAPLHALELAGLKQPEDRASDAARAELARLRDRGLIRWVVWAEPAEDGKPGRLLRGFVLTGLGEGLLDTYDQRYGPALARRAEPRLSLGELARQRLQAPSTTPEQADE